MIVQQHKNVNEKIINPIGTRSVMSPTIYIAAGDSHDSSLNLNVFMTNVIKNPTKTLFNMHHIQLGQIFYSVLKRSDNVKSPDLPSQNLP